MDSPTKLATFLRNAANGEVEDLPTGLSTALRFLLTVKRGMLEEIATMPASDVDNALEATARLALSLRSDELDELATIEVDVLEDLLEGRRRELGPEGFKAVLTGGDIAALESRHGGIVLGVDVD